MRFSVRTRALALAVTAGAMLTAPLALPASAAVAVERHVREVSSGRGQPDGERRRPRRRSLIVHTRSPGRWGSEPVPPRRRRRAGSSSGSVGFKITWKGGKGTTTAASKFTIATDARQVPGGRRVQAPRRRRLGQGRNRRRGEHHKVGQSVTASQCVIVSGAKAGTSMLEPGTKFKL